MDFTMTHVCLRTDTAPAPDEPHELGDRWICSCGDNYVYREGFNRAGYPSDEWWPAPPIPQPRSERSVRGLLFGPRKG